MQLIEHITMKKFFISLISAFAILSCQQEQLGLDNLQKFSASVETFSTRTALGEDNAILWESSDMVSIFAKSNANLTYKVAQGDGGKSSCTLTSVQSSGNVAGEPFAHNVAYYPYAEIIQCDKTSSAYVLSQVDLPEVQNYSAGSFASGAFPMVAVSLSNSLSFRNICGAVVVQATGTSRISSVTLSGYKYEKLSGSATVTAYINGFPTVEMSVDANEYVVLDCGEGVQLDPVVPTEFIISVPPTEFKEGFKLVFKDTANKRYTVDTTKYNKVERSSLLVMPPVELAVPDEGGDDDGEDNEDNGFEYPFIIQHEGLQYIWDESVIPEITMSFTLSEWNRFLAAYDANPSNKEYFYTNITYKKGEDLYTINDAGVRLRGNTSRRRPEAYRGEGEHQKNAADWQHCHFGVNLRKFVRDSDHEIKKIRKFNLKWFNDDACYVRELFCYDLFRRAGIWTAAHDVYCRLWIHVEGDSAPAYYGVYEMIEPYDNKYLEKREHLFGTSDGHLWKCSYDSHGPADLSNPDANMAEDNDRDDFTYELKEYGDDSDFDTAKAQLQDFIKKLNGKAHGTPGDSFYKWIKEVCDVDLLMRTYAVNVAVGMWDDMWNNGNNYYLYFTTSHLTDYKFFLIPYDYDNTLGTSNAYDSARQDPYNWGNKGVLMNRMMEYEEFRKIYRDELKRLVDPANGLMDTESSVARIKAWQAKIQQYIENDTDEDMRIEDKPAGWGNWGDYNLMDYNNNYFTVKAETINKMR